LPGLSSRVESAPRSGATDAPGFQVTEPSRLLDPKLVTTAIGASRRRLGAGALPALHVAHGPPLVSGTLMLASLRVLLSMPGSCEVPDGLTHRPPIASPWKEQRAYSTGPLEPPLSSSS
jgi:hypothetical protein